MSRIKNLFKDTLIFMIGSFGAKLISIIMLPFYTKYLNPSDYGKLDLILVTSTLIMPFISLQVSDGVYRNLIEVSDFKVKKSIISSALNATILFFLGAFLLFYLVGEFGLFDKKIIFYLYGIVVSGILYDLTNQILRGLKFSRLYALSGVLYSLFFMGCSILFIAYFKKGVIGYLYAQILTNVLTTLIILCAGRLHNYYRFSIEKYFIKKIYSYSIPLIFNTVGWWILMVSDRYVLNFYKGTSSVGIYSLANKISSIIYLFNSIFFLAWQTNSIMEIDSLDRDAYYSLVFRYFMTFQFAITLMMIYLSYPLIKIFTNLRYLASWQYIPILSIAILFNTFASYYANSYIILRKTTTILITTLIGAGLNIILNIVLVPYLNIYGACISTLISYIVVWLIRLNDRNIEITIVYENSIFIKNMINIVVITFVILINIDVKYKVIMVVSSIIFYYVINRKLIDKAAVKSTLIISKVLSNK